MVLAEYVEADPSLSAPARPRIERSGDPSAPAKGSIEFESLDRGSSFL